MDLNRAKLFSPTVDLISTNPKRVQFAIYAHLVALIGGVVLALISLVSLAQDPIWAIISIIVGIFVVVIELDMISFPELKSPEIRGIIWIVFGILGFQTSLLAGIIILSSGVLYLVYYNDY